MAQKPRRRGNRYSCLPSKNNRKDERDPQISRRKYTALALIAIAIAVVFIYRTVTDNAALESFVDFRVAGVSNHSTVNKLADTVAQKRTTTTIPIPPTTDEDLFFFNTTWPPIRNAVCINGSPNIVLGSTLFELARQEVFGSKDGTTTTTTTMTTTTTTTNSKYIPTRTPNPVGTTKDLNLKHFFHGDFGASVFMGINNDTGGNFSTIYARIFKCGNNQIRAMEHEFFQYHGGQYRDGGQRKDHVSLAKALAHGKRYEGPPPCIYTAIRDPISHFLSGYNEVEFLLLDQKKNRKFQPFLAPYHRAFPYSKNSTVLRKKRFLAFVEDLLLENKILGSHYVYLHFYPMSRILRVLRKYNTNLTGYINGLESLTSTWPDFMVSTCGGELGFPSRERLPVEMKVAGQHDSSNDPLGLYQAAKDVWAEQGPIARALCLLYAFDYACFPKLPIPALCRSVYRDHSNTIVEKANRTMVSKTGRHYGERRRK